MHSVEHFVVVIDTGAACRDSPLATSDEVHGLVEDIRVDHSVVRVVKAVSTDGKKRNQDPKL